MWLQACSVRLRLRLRLQARGRAGGRACRDVRLRCDAAGPRQAVERPAAPSTFSVLWPPTHAVVAGAAARASVRCRTRARAAGGRDAETTVHLVNGRPTLVSDHQEQQVHTLETTGLPRQIRESMLHTGSHFCCGVGRRAQLRLAARERSEWAREGGRGIIRQPATT